MAQQGARETSKATSAATSQQAISALVTEVDHGSENTTAAASQSTARATSGEVRRPASEWKKTDSLFRMLDIKSSAAHGRLRGRCAVNISDIRF